MYAASTATLESHDHVYREAFLALTACGLGDLLLREGRADAALTEFRRASRLVKEYPRMLGRQRVLARTLAGMGARPCCEERICARTRVADGGCAAPEQKLLRAHRRGFGKHSWGELYCSLGAAYARLGESDVALDWIEKAMRYGWRDAHWLASDPEFVPLDSQPRFQTLQENLKLLPVLKFKTSAEP